jgi:hypothetical protein
VEASDGTMKFAKHAKIKDVLVSGGQYSLPSILVKIGDWFVCAGKSAQNGCKLGGWESMLALWLPPSKFAESSENCGKG